MELNSLADPHLARLRRLDCCALSDALDALGLPEVITGIPQQSGRGRIAGRAVTLRVGIGEPPPGPKRHLGTTAIETCAPGGVVVIEQRSGIDAGCWGGLLTLAAKLRGLAGAVVDGPVRDIDEAITYEWPIFARKLTARTARGRVVELGTNVPISFEGRRVNPGDYIVADRSGVIVVSPENIGEVLEHAERIVAREAVMARALIGGTPPSEVMASSYETMLEPDGE